MTAIPFKKGAANKKTRFVNKKLGKWNPTAARSIQKMQTKRAAGRTMGRGRRG